MAKSTVTSKDKRIPAASGKRSHHGSSSHNASDRKIVTSLEKFAHKKGQVRALEEFRKRKEKKQVETSIRLRQYKKVMKQEGMEAGTGASRKRRVDAEDDETEEPASQHENKKQKRHKADPLQKSVKKAEQYKQQAIEREKQQKQNEKDRQQKLEQRKRTSKQLQKRTKRGQPIIKHMVNNLLHKLEKQNDNM